MLPSRSVLATCIGRCVVPIQGFTKGTTLEGGRPDIGADGLRPFALEANVKKLGAIKRALGVVVMTLTLLGGLPMAAQAAPAATTEAAAQSPHVEAAAATQKFEQRYAERAGNSETLQNFEGGQGGGAGVYIGGTTLVLVLLIVLILVIL